MDASETLRKWIGKSVEVRSSMVTVRGTMHYSGVDPSGPLICCFQVRVNCGFTILGWANFKVEDVKGVGVTNLGVRVIELKN